MYHTWLQYVSSPLVNSCASTHSTVQTLLLPLRWPHHQVREWLCHFDRRPSPLRRLRPIHRRPDPSTTPPWPWSPSSSLAKPPDRATPSRTRPLDPPSTSERCTCASRSSTTHVSPGDDACSGCPCARAGLEAAECRYKAPTVLCLGLGLNSQLSGADLHRNCLCTDGRLPHWSSM